MRALVELSLQAAVQLFFMFIQSGLTALQPGEAGPLPACPGQPVSFPIQDLHPAGTILYQARPESYTWQQIFSNLMLDNWNDCSIIGVSNSSILPGGRHDHRSL